MELINPTTKKWIDAYVKRPQSALIMNSSGDQLFGQKICEYIYTELNNSKNCPLYIVELIDKKSIGIEDIRDLKVNLSLKANNQGEYSRFVLIKDADKLTTEAQNSLLKLIEELPDKTVVMMVVSDTSNILETIKSRCFSINLLPIARTQGEKYGKLNNVEAKKTEKAFLISEGKTTDFLELVHDSNTNIEDSIILAKKYLSINQIDRQKINLDIIKNGDSLEFVQSLKLTAKIGMKYSRDVKSKNKWKNVIRETIYTENLLSNNVNSKLALLSLSVSL